MPLTALHCKRKMSTEEEGRSAKRQRSSLEPDEGKQILKSLADAETMAEGTVDVITDGDILLAVSGVAGLGKT
jgi:hypothetical protein